MEGEVIVLKLRAVFLVPVTAPEARGRVLLKLIQSTFAFLLPIRWQLKSWHVVSFVRSLQFSRCGRNGQLPLEINAERLVPDRDCGDSRCWRLGIHADYAPMNVDENGLASSSDPFESDDFAKTWANTFSFLVMCSASP
jgi:hypothetical protein